MFRSRHLVALLFGLIACDKLAGFESFSGRSDEVAPAAGNAGASNGGAGTVANAGGTVANTAGSTATMGGATGSGGFVAEAAGESGAGGAGSGGTANESGGTRNEGGGAALGGASVGGANHGGATQGGSAQGGVTQAAQGGNAQGGNASGGAPQGGSDQCGELLINGAFDAGVTGWSEYSSWPGLEPIARKGDAGLAAQGVAPYSGDYLAWLGGIPDVDFGHHEYVRLSQQVQIPASTAALRMSGVVWVKHSVPANDYGSIALFELGADNPSLYFELFDDETPPMTGWTSFTITSSGSDIAGLLGKTLTFELDSDTDAEVETHFFFDSLSLTAICGH